MDATISISIRGSDRERAEEMGCSTSKARALFFMPWIQLVGVPFPV
jgi:hypothetical protein